MLRWTLFIKNTEDVKKFLLYIYIKIDIIYGFPRSGCWRADPGGYFAGATNLSRAEYKMALRLRLLRSPASLDVGDVEGGIVCRCNRRINIIADPMHFFHCPSSQDQFILRCHNHIRDAIMMDQMPS